MSYDDFGSTETQEQVSVSESEQSEDLSRSLWDELKASVTERFTARDDKEKSSASGTIEITNVFDATPPASSKQAAVGQRQDAPSEADAAKGKPAEKSADDAAARSEAKSEGTPDTKPETKQVDRVQCEAAADAIEKACNQGGLFGAGTDKEAIYAVLKDKTEAERQEIDRIFQEKYGNKIAKDKGLPKWGLKEEFEDELSGADLDKAMNMLSRKDGSSDRAGRIHAALIERGQWIEGRSNATVEKDIRDTLATMNSDQIAQLKKEWDDKYKGEVKTLEQALLDDPNLSESSKEAIKIYLKGSDQRDKMQDGKADPNFSDTMKLADLALKSKDLEKFKEVMSTASPEARKYFMENNGGEQKMKDAFEGHWYNAMPYLAVLVPGGQIPGLVGGAMTGRVSDEDLNDAKEYAEKGKLSTANILAKNQSWAGDNEKAIEKALNDMSAQERKAYLDGRALAAGKEVAGLTEEQKTTALKTYKEIHDQLEDAGNASEIARWEDMIEHKGGSLVARIASHSGTLYTDSRGDVLKEIENMTQADWENAKKHPEYREEVKKALQELKGVRISQEDIDKALKMYDEKVAADKYENSLGKGRRTLTEALQDDSHWYGNDRKSMVDSIAHMTPEEQKKYRDNQDGFRDKVDAAVKESLGDGPAGEAAVRMLARVKEGKAPDDDIVSKLLVRAQEQKDLDAKVLAGSVVLGGVAGIAGTASDTYLNDGAGRDAIVGSRSKDVVKDLQEAFEKDPTLRTRLMAKPPANAEDERLQKDFDKAIHQAVSNRDYDKYVKPLMDTGRLSIEKQMELKKSLVDDDEQAAYKDLVALANDKSAEGKAEREKILTDMGYQTKVLGFLSSDERAIALNALKQGEMRPEDKLRSYMVGAGTGEEEIKQELAKIRDREQYRQLGMSGEQIDKAIQKRMEELKHAYAVKYGSDLTADLLDELGGQDARDAKRAMLRDPQSAEEAFDRARDEHYDSYDGIGKSWTNKMWDGTGYQTEEAYNAFYKAMTDASAKFEELPKEEQRRLVENLQKQLDLFVESKGALADGLTDGAIAAACIAAGFVTEGSTWVILGALVAGGFFKAGAKGIIMGADYDWRSSQALVDFAAGGVDAALNFVSFGAGSVAAKTILKEGGEQLIKKGGKEALERGLSQLAKESMKNAGKEISEEAVEKLAKELAKDGLDEQAKKALRELIKQNLPKAIDEAKEGLLKQMVKDAIRNAPAGALGGGGSGAVRALAMWDETKSFEQNMAMVGKTAATAAAFGAAGAVAATVVFKVGGKAYHALKEHYNLKAAETPTPETVAKIKEDIKKATGKDVEVKVTQDGNIEITTKVEKPSSGKQQLPEFDRAGISLEEQARFHEFAQESELIKPKQMDALLDSVRDGTKDWKDVSRLVDEAKASQEAVLKSGDRYLAEVQEPLKQKLIAEGRSPAEADRLVTDSVEVRKLVANDPEKLKVLDDFLRARDVNMQNKFEVSKELKLREAQVRKMIEEHAASNGLDVRSVEFHDSQMMDGGLGSHHPGKGDIVINKSLLLAKDPGALIEAMTHEMVHAEQDALVIRAMAQDANIKHPPTAQQLKDLKAEYQKRTGRELLDEHAKAVLEKNKGKLELDDDQLARADKLADAIKKNASPGQAGERLGDDLRVTDIELRKLTTEPPDPRASLRLIERLSDDKNGTLARHLFKDGAIPPEVQKLIDLQRKIAAGENVTWPANTARETLLDRLHMRHYDLSVQIQELNAKYFSTRDEQEAWIIGREARNRAAERGMSNPNATARELGLPEETNIERAPDTQRAGDRPQEMRVISGDTPNAADAEKLAAARKQMAFEPDAEQRALITGRVEGEPKKMTGGLSNIPPEEIQIRTADGKPHRAVFHPEDASSKQRLAKELAAYKINREIGFDNGYPVTVPGPVEINGVRKPGWIQEHGGERLDGFLKSNDVSAPQDLRRMFQENPGLKEQMENAWIERMLLGDHEEIRPGNMVISKEGGKIRVQNIDVEYAFGVNGENLVPEMDVVAQRGVFALAAHEFSGQPINPEMLKRLRDFVNRYDNPAEFDRLVAEGRSPIEARRILARPFAEKTGLTDDQAMRVLERARYFAETGRFPPAKGYQAADPAFKAAVEAEKNSARK